LNFSGTISQDIQDLLLGAVLITGLLIFFALYLGKNETSGIHQKESSDSGFYQNTPSSNIHNVHGLQDANADDWRKVDHHLKVSEINKNLQQTQIYLENQRILEHSEDLGEVVTEDVTRYGLRPYVETGAVEVEKGINRHNFQRRRPSAQDKIEMQIAQEQYVEDYDRKLQRAYVNKFIENMEKSGYEVKINDQLQVVRVKKIQSP
jgi:hypothetical protein